MSREPRALPVTARVEEAGVCQAPRLNHHNLLIVDVLPDIDAFDVLAHEPRYQPYG